MAKDARKEIGRVSDRQMRAERKEVEALFKDVDKSSEAVNKLIDIIRSSLPKMKELFSSLENSRHLAEEQERKEVLALADFEKWVVDTLLKYFSKKHAVRILDVLLKDEKGIEDELRLQIRSDGCIFRGKRPAGHLLRRYFAPEYARARDEDRRQREIRAHVSMENVSRDKLASLLEQLEMMKGKPSHIAKAENELAEEAENLLKLMAYNFFNMFEFEWDVDEDEAILLEQGRLYLAALRHLERKGVKGTDELQKETEDLVNQYSRNYIQQDVHDAKKLEGFMHDMRDAAIAQMDAVKKGKAGEWWKNNWKKAIFGQGIVRMMVDSEFREYCKNYYPSLVPVIVRAVATKGKSVFNPADLQIIYDVLVDKNPDIPKPFRKMIDDIRKTPIGKLLVKKGVKKVEEAVAEAV